MFLICCPDRNHHKFSDDKCNPAVVYPILKVVITAVGLGVACGIHSTDSDKYDAKIAILKGADLGYVYLAVWLLDLTLYAQQIFVALGRKKSYADNPDQYIYEAVGKGEVYVRLVEDGVVGAFNRAQRGIDNTRETFPMVVAQTLLAGYVYPKVVLGLAVLFFFGRCLYSHGYIQGAKSRVPGLFLTMLVCGIGLGGLQLFIGVKAVM